MVDGGGSNKTGTREASVFNRVWILSDGKAGDLAQCRGVAEQLGVHAKILIVSPGKPWVWLMPYGPLSPVDRIGGDNSPLSHPLPDLVIAAGWRTLAYVREIKKHQKSAVFTVFLKNPRCRAGYLDLIWAPDHDRLSGSRVISSIASPHRFSPRILREKYASKPDCLSMLSAPLIGVLLGGDSKDYHFSNEDCTRLASSLLGLAQNGAGLAITSSRRTPDRLKRAIKQTLEGHEIYWWNELDNNPYGYLLAHSDYFVVTADSANMIGEPCVSGKPVYVFRPSGGSKKFDRLLVAFEELGATKPLPEKIEKLVPWHYDPLFAAQDIALEIKKRAIRQFEINPSS